MKKYYILLVILILLLSLCIYSMLDIDFIYKSPNEILMLSGNSLVLKEARNHVKIPHLNVRGIVDGVNGDVYYITLSNNSQKFLDTQTIQIYAPNITIPLEKDDDVFIKFKNIEIKDNTLEFKYLEVYKYFDIIDKEEIGKVKWYAVNYFGGFITYTGTEFVFNGNKYVDFDEDLSSDGKFYFVDIYDEQLLYEEYKNVFPPMKWYNMVNPQETYYDVIVEIYS